MTDIRFHAEWQDGEGIAGPELAATFASLRIDVDGKPLTRVLDNRAQTTRDAIYVPLYPVAEWMVSNWWFLRYESENTTKRSAPAFRRRHSLRTSTDGYALPDLTMVTLGARTNLQWNSSSSDWTKTEFLSRGQATLESQKLMEECARFVDNVTRRLVARDIETTFLQDEWKAIQNTDDEEEEFCAMSAKLGWDPYDLDETKQSQLLELVDKLGELSGEATQVIDASAPLEDCSAILNAISASKNNLLKLPASLPRMVSPPFSESLPWVAGYELARQARSELGLNGQPVSDTESLALTLSQDPEQLKQVTIPVEPLNRLSLVDGVVTRGEPGSVSFGLKSKGEVGKRFLFCRMLAEAISSEGNALVTRGDTDRQQRNRAFAAEFLAPFVALENKISGSVVDEAQIEDLAEEFGVYTKVIEHQVTNHRIAEIV